MLATLGEGPFDSADHLFEVKWDGVRTLAFCEAGVTRLFSRTGREVTHQYPEFSELHKQLGRSNAVLDGEIVALDSAGRPSFERLQNRINLARPGDISRGVERIQLDLVLFDQLFSDDRWLGDLTIENRVALLESSVLFEERVLKSDSIPEHGKALFDAACERGLEGIVAKKRGSHYFPGKRTRDWIKIKSVSRADCVIGGWTPGLGGRGGSLGALLVGVYGPEGLVYIGSVGTGFTDRTLSEVRGRLEKVEAAQSPFSQPVAVKGARWVRPELVCEVEYRELTSGKKLRAPSFKGLRTDKAPEDCLLADLV